MGRSGRLLAKNDEVILQLVNDPLFDIKADGTIWSQRTRQGHMAPKGHFRLCILTKRTGSSGYSALFLKYKEKWLAVHRIVYAKHVGCLAQDLCINHIDGNSLNNSADNLELVTQAQNNRHARQTKMSRKNT